MAGDLELKLKIRALVQGIGEVQRLAGEVKGLAGAAGRAVPDPTVSMRGGLGETAGAVRGLASEFAAFLAAIGAYKALSLVADGIRGLVSEGMRYNETLESGRLGIATLIAAQAEVRDSGGRVLRGQEALNAAMGLGDEQLKKLRIAGLETSATFEQLAAAYQVALGPGLAAGLNLDQIRDITVRITQAAAALGVPMNQLNQEVRALLEGTITEDARIAKTLGITGEMVKGWKETGRLADELEERFVVFALAGARAAQTWTALASNLRDAWSMLAGQSISPLSEKVKAALLDAFGRLTENGEISGEFRGIVTALEDAARVAGDLAGGAIRWLVDEAAALSKYYEEHGTEWRMILEAAGEVARQVGALVGEVFSLGQRTNESTTNFEMMWDILQGVARAVAAIRDGLSFWLMVIANIGRNLSDLVLYPLEKILQGMAAIAPTEGLASQFRTAAREAKAEREEVGAWGAAVAGPFWRDVMAGETALSRLDARMRQTMSAHGAAGAPSAGAGATAGAKPGSTPEEKANADAVLKTVDALKEKALALDETSAKEVEAALRAKGATEAQIVEAKAYIALIAAKKSSVDTARDRGRDREEVNRTVQGLEREVETLGKGRAALVDYELAARHATPEQRKLAEELVKTAERAREQEAIRETIEGLRQEAETLGYTGRQLALYKMALQGASAEQLVLADGLLAQKERFQEISDLRQRLIEQSNQAIADDEREAEAILNEIDPLRKIAEQLRIINELAAATGKRSAFLSPTEADAARRKVYFEQWKAEFPLLAQAAQQAAQGMESAFAQFFYAPMKAGLEGLLQAFIDMLRQIMARLMAAQLTSWIMGAFGAGAGGGGGAAPVEVHSGGIIGQSLKTREVSPVAFIGAPRLHAGAVLGLRSDEIPAILQRGEEVITRSDPRHALNSAGAARGGGERIRILNVVDKDLTHDYMASSEGEKVILNVIRKNAGGVRQLLGAF